MLGISPLRRLFSLVIALTGASACATTGAPTADGAPAAAGPTAGQSAGGDWSGSGGTSGGITIDVDTSMTPPPEGLTEDAACGIGTARARLQQLTLMVMFDRSGRMVNSGSVDPVTMLNRWQRATAALTSFFQNPKAAGLGVALRFFPDNYPVGRCTNAACDVDACARVFVDAGTLTADPAPADAHEAALLDAIAVSAPADGAMGGGEPIHAALEGALSWAATYQAQHDNQKTAVVLVTDGNPLGCNEDFRDIASLAADALAMNGVPTYAIGLADSMGNGANTDLMNQVATAGGTKRAFFVNDSPTSAAVLLDAFDTIRGAALPCDFPLPDATDNGKPVDTTNVNVTFRAIDGEETTFTKAEAEAKCGTEASWYYDDEGAPTRIYLCPTACNLAAHELGAEFEVLVGCKTRIQTPR